jgi:hypothetical protein
MTDQAGAARHGSPFVIARNEAIHRLPAIEDAMATSVAVIARNQAIHRHDETH